MYSCKYSERLKKGLKKLFKKDKSLYQQVINKIQEIIDNPNVEHYKNLKYNMRDSKRVQIGHFVLVFQHNKKNSKINFDDFDHHDNIYKKKF